MGNNMPSKLMRLRDKNVTGFQNLICAPTHAYWALLHHPGARVRIAIDESSPVRVPCWLPGIRHRQVRNK